MKRFIVSVVPVLIILSVILSACGGASGVTPQPTAAGSTGAQPTAAPVATEAATTAPVATEAATTAPVATEAATTAPSATETMTTTTGTSSGTAGQITLPSNCTNVSLQYWNPFTGPDGPFMGQIVDSFNQANPNVNVTMTTQSDYMTQYQTAAASGTLPEVLIVNEDVVGTAAFRNIIRPMDDIVQQIGVTGSDYPAVAWNAGEVAGKRYAIPLSFVAMTMYYNADLFEKAGISAPPTNADEFAADAAKLTQGNVKGFDITGGFPVQQIFQMLLHQFGGSEFNQDYTQATWNSDAGVQALQWMKDAQQKYSEPNLEVDAELNAFKAGSAAMVWNGIWQQPNLTGSGVEFKGMATSVPQIGTQPAVWAGGPLLALGVQPNVDPCKDAGAAMFIKYLIDHSVDWAKAGNIPALNSARNSAEFQQLPQSAIAPSLENPVFPPPVPGISDAFAPLGDAVGSIMNGTATDIKATLDDSVQRANAILQQNLATYGSAPGGK